MKIPSPAEVEAVATANRGWTRKQLAAWGVPWPPPRGWRKRLREDYFAQRRGEPVAQEEFIDTQRIYADGVLRTNDEWRKIWAAFDRR